MDWGRFDSQWLDKKLKTKYFWVQESGDDSQKLPRKNFPKAERFHITLSPDFESTTEYRKRNIDAHWWTHFADTRVQFPIETKPEYVAVTTRNGGSQFLDTLTQHGGGTIGNQNGLAKRTYYRI